MDLGIANYLTKKGAHWPKNSLAYFAEHGILNQVKKLVKPIESRNKEDERWALYCAITGGSIKENEDHKEKLEGKIKVVQFLLERGFNVSNLPFKIPNILYRTSFSLRMRKLLLDGGADYTKKPGDKDPYHGARGLVLSWHTHVHDIIFPLMKQSGYEHFNYAQKPWHAAEDRVTDKDKHDYTSEHAYNDYVKYVLEDFGEFMATQAIYNDDASALHKIEKLYRDSEHWAELHRKFLTLAETRDATNCYSALISYNVNIDTLITYPILNRSSCSFKGKSLTDDLISTWSWNNALLTVTSIDFSHNKLTGRCLSKLAELTNNSNSLRYLNLSHNKISLDPSKKSDDDFYAPWLKSLLDKNSSLTELNLASNGIELQSACKIASALKNNENLVKLNLSDNLIYPGNTFLKKLIKVTKTNPNIKKRLTIDLSGNFITVENNALKKHRKSTPTLIMNSGIKQSIVHPEIKLKTITCHPLVSKNVWLVFYMSQNKYSFNPGDHATLLIEGMRPNGQRFILKIDAGTGDPLNIINEISSSLPEKTDLIKSYNVNGLKISVNRVIPKGTKQSIHGIARKYPRFLMWACSNIEAQSILDEIDEFGTAKKDSTKYNLIGRGEGFNCAKFLAEVSKPARIKLALDRTNSPSSATSEYALKPNI